MGALERATVRSRTVAAPFQPPPATSALPLTPADAPRRPQHDSWSAPSSFPLPCPCSHTHHGRPSAPVSTLTRAMPLTPLLSLFSPLALDRIQEHPRHTTTSSRG